MIGRAATKNPWIFRQAADLARRARAAGGRRSLERRDLILEHFRLVAAREPSKYALHKLRKFTGWYTHGVPHGRELRQRINELHDVPTFLAAVEEFFDELDQSPRRSARGVAANRRSRSGPRRRAGAAA